MFKYILLIFITIFSSFSFAQMDHSSHMHTPEIQLVETNLQSKPEMMRATSVELLESPIGITQDHGQGNFFKKETTKTEELVNQGFAMLNTFQYTDAFRSFNTAINIEPTSVESYIGRAFASISLDSSQTYYLGITNEFLKRNKDALTKEQTGWANLILSIMTQLDINENPLSVSEAFNTLLVDDPNNVEVLVFANWVSNTYDLELLRRVVNEDPENAGATHYLLHLAEMQSDHDTALIHGENLSRLALGSGHGQHMLGHVLPHFNRWSEADDQFTLAHKIHIDWANKNNVHPSEDWHYSHNLDLWSVSKMVLNPTEAISILEELEGYSYSYSLDLLDLRIILADDAKAESEKIASYEMRSEDWRNFVSSSRKLHTLINQSEEFEQIVPRILENLNWENSTKDNTLYVSLILIEANRRGDQETQSNAINYITSSLSTEFARGGFDGWRKSVLETLIYTRIFEVYNLTQASQALKDQVTNIYMNPVD